MTLPDEPLCLGPVFPCQLVEAIAEGDDPCAQGQPRLFQLVQMSSARDSCTLESAGKSAISSAC